MFLNLILLLIINILVCLLMEHFWYTEGSKHGFSAKTVQQLNKINDYYARGGRVTLDEKNKMKLRRYNVKKDKRNG